MQILSRRAFSTFRIFPRRGRIACVARLRGFAEPPAESPRPGRSHSFRILVGTVCQFSRQDIPSGADFLLVRSRAFLAASRTLGKQDFQRSFCDSRVLLQEQLELSAHDIVDCLRLAVQVSALSGPSNCGSSILMLTIAVIPSRYPPVRFGSLSFNSLFACIFIKGFRQRIPEAHDMGTALRRRNVVDETVRIFLIGIVVLHRNLNENAVSFSSQ